MINSNYKEIEFDWIEDLIDKKYYDKSSNTRGIRNNNPFNIVRSKNKWLGKIPFDKSTDFKFEQFDSMEYGIRAGIKLLQNYIRKNHVIYGRRNTLRKIITCYAPPSENNFGAYYRFMLDWLIVNDQVNCHLVDGHYEGDKDPIIKFPSERFNHLCVAIMYYESSYLVPPEHITYIVERFKLY